MKKTKIVLGAGILIIFLIGLTYFITQSGQSSNLKSGQVNKTSTENQEGKEYSSEDLEEGEGQEYPEGYDGGIYESKIDVNVKTSATTTTTTKTSDSSETSLVLYPMSEVVKHNSSASCYAVIDNSIYDLTSWINKHPGGAQAIKSLCGKNGTEAFYDQHGGQTKPENILAGFKIGELE